ncbi:MAG: DUF882 domain-containing protein [Polyangiaceae bacterium]
MRFGLPPVLALTGVVAAALAALAPEPIAEAKDKKRSSYVGKPAHPGVVHVKRLATSEDITVRATSHGRVTPEAMRKFATLMRSPTGANHSIDPRLIALVGVVSDHFAGRTIEVISGYRPFTTKQYTPHSNHNHGKAIDFRVVGVPNEVVRDFCRTLHNTGCGYYPNSVFVHMDVRSSSAFWIDYSRPGEPPRYHKPGAEADEGTSDVPGEADSAAPAAPPPASPAANPAPAPAAPVAPAAPAAAAQ